MAGLRNFRDLDAHKLAVLVRRRVFALTRSGSVTKDFKFVDQIRDAARGGPRNIAEGFSRFKPTEFHQFLSYAKSTLDETGDAIEDGFESGYFTGEQKDEVLALIDRANGAISRLMRYLESPAAARFYAAHQVRRGKDRSNPQNRENAKNPKNPEPNEPSNPEPSNPEPS